MERRDKPLAGSTLLQKRGAPGERYRARANASAVHSLRRDLDREVAHRYLLISFINDVTHSEHALVKVSDAAARDAVNVEPRNERRAGFDGMVVLEDVGSCRAVRRWRATTA